MSRCLPFPTPAYANTESYRLALVELIKLQKEKEEAKRERREEKNLKKKLRKEYKDKEKRRHRCVANDKLKDEDRYYQLENSRAGLKEAYPLKRVDEYDSEQLDKSDLTEEHEQPTHSQCIYYLSDSARSSLKRKQHDTLVGDRESQSTSSSFWLSLWKHGEPDASLSEQDGNCSKQETKEQFCHTNAKEDVEYEQLTLKRCLGLPLLTPERTEARIAKKTSSYVNQIRREGSLYKALIEKWNPDPPTQHAFDDEEWLFDSKNQQHRQESKRHKASDDVTRSRSSTVRWPQAKFLSEVDLWALPYTVTF